METAFRKITNRHLLICALIYLILFSILNRLELFLHGLPILLYIVYLAYFLSFVIITKKNRLISSSLFFIITSLIVFEFLMIFFMVYFDSALKLRPHQEMYFYEHLILLIFACSITFVNPYFQSKLLVANEKKRNVKFSEHVGEFFTLIFVVVGFWFIIPRINKLFKENEIVSK